MPANRSTRSAGIGRLVEGLAPRVGHPGYPPDQVEQGPAFSRPAHQDQKPTRVPAPRLKDNDQAAESQPSAVPSSTKP